MPRRSSRSERGAWKTSMLVPMVALALLSGCTLVGQGEGEVRSERLVAKDCWADPYDLNPTFFAAVPYREQQQIRVQRGADLLEVSDGMSVLVNDVTTVRTERLGEPLSVGLSPQLLNTIAPGVPPPEAPDVSMSLYLQFSCHNQNIVLYALSGTITFTDLFNNDPNESAGHEKLTDATFDVMVGNPRDALPGTLDVPPELLSPLKGWFTYQFQRGQPGQPFP